jgi:hypothetical protein
MTFYSDYKYEFDMNQGSTNLQKATGIFDFFISITLYRLYMYINPLHMPADWDNEGMIKSPLYKYMDPLYMPTDWDNDGIIKSPLYKDPQTSSYAC